MITYIWFQNTLSYFLWDESCVFTQSGARRSRLSCLTLSLVIATAAVWWLTCQGHEPSGSCRIWWNLEWIKHLVWTGWKISVLLSNFARFTLRWAQEHYQPSTCILDNELGTGTLRVDYRDSKAIPLAWFDFPVKMFILSTKRTLSHLHPSSSLITKGRKSGAGYWLRSYPESQHKRLCEKRPSVKTKALPGTSFY